VESFVVDQLEGPTVLTQVVAFPCSFGPGQIGQLWGVGVQSHPNGIANWAGKILHIEQRPQDFVTLILRAKQYVE
jgi:hypothetical protein